MGPIIATWNRFLEQRFPLRPALLSRSPRIGGQEKLKVEADEYGSQRRPTTPLGSTVQQPVSALAVCKRLASDQLIMAPLGLLTFLTFFAIAQGLDFDGWRKNLATLYVPLLLANWSVWPVVQLVNFRRVYRYGSTDLRSFVPLKYRVPFSASCGMAWTCYLSFKSSAKG